MYNEEESPLNAQRRESFGSLPYMFVTVVSAKSIIFRFFTVHVLIYI